METKFKEVSFPSLIIYNLSIINLQWFRNLYHTIVISDTVKIKLDQQSTEVFTCHVTGWI
jgi:hypothetical protein